MGGAPAEWVAAYRGGYCVPAGGRSDGAPGVAGLPGLADGHSLPRCGGGAGWPGGLATGYWFGETWPGPRGVAAEPLSDGATSPRSAPSGRTAVPGCSPACAAAAARRAAIPAASDAPDRVVEP